MTKRTPVSAPQNAWFDSEQVGDTALTLEQQFNDTITSDIINNHIGSGILQEKLQQNIIFDSNLAQNLGFLDGTIINAQAQPTDNNFGNQLSITLSNSTAAGVKAVKIAIIGLDFQSNLQFETFYFHINETQNSRRHYTKILLILFNDFIGDPSLSLNLGGRVVIAETNALSLSRDPLMVSQDLQPNLFFRDFFVDGFTTLNMLLQTALPLYNIDSLNIFTSQLDTQIITANDVTTQVGQKFLATTNNIQKITILLSVQNDNNPSDLAWTGDLLISIYPLQSSVICESDIAPNLAIDFAPANIPVAQISVDYSTLGSDGVILDTVPQPIDFVFSNSAAGGTGIVANSYYAATIKRAGSANKCDILISTGQDLTSNSRITTFTGSVWVDNPDQDLWFQVWTDSAKVSDGQAYDTGHGISINKTTIDPTTQNTIDLTFGGLAFTGNQTFSAVLTATTQESVPVTDPRTGDPVLTQKQYIPNISLLNPIDLANLQNVTEPLLLGAISDQNIKFFDPSQIEIDAKLYSATLANDELLIRIVDDPTDTGRFDTNVNSLMSSLLNGSFVEGKIFPDANNHSIFYRIGNAQLDSMIVGDVDGDGVITYNDLNLLESYLNYNLNIGLPTHSSVITDGYHTTFINGYETYIQAFTNKNSIPFQLVDPNTNDVLVASNDGVLTVNPNDPRLASFGSSSVHFNSILGVSSYKLIILTPSTDANYGGFNIIGLDDVADTITLQKIVLTGDVLGQMLRADIDGDFVITNNDGYLLDSYLERTPLPFPPAPPNPGPTSNPYLKIGTRFNVIRFKVEQFTDRTDDYSTTMTAGRSTAVHPIPDIFLTDGYFAGHNFYTSPIPIEFNKQLSWNDWLIVVNTAAKSVPAIFSTETGLIVPQCQIEGIQPSFYPDIPEFDPGRLDFYVPNNLIIGMGGQLTRPDGYYYKVDLEAATITLEIPPTTNGEQTINLMDAFVTDYTGNGITRLGYPALKFADCTYADNTALINNQIRFVIAIQSFSPQLDGYSVDGYAGVIVDDRMGVDVDYSTGIATFNFSNLYIDPVLQTRNTKVLINILLKKAGFNNQPLIVPSDQVANIFGN